MHLTLNVASMALRRSDDVVARRPNPAMSPRPVYHQETHVLVPGNGEEDVGERIYDSARVLKFLDDVLYPSKAE